MVCLEVIRAILKHVFSAFHKIFMGVKTDKSWKKWTLLGLTGLSFILQLAGLFVWVRYQLLYQSINIIVGRHCIFFWQKRGWWNGVHVRSELSGTLVRSCIYNSMIGACTMVCYRHLWMKNVHGTLAEMTGNDWNVLHVRRPRFIAPQKIPSEQSAS